MRATSSKARIGHRWLHGSGRSGRTWVGGGVWPLARSRASWRGPRRSTRQLTAARPASRRRTGRRRHRTAAAPRPYTGRRRPGSAGGTGSRSGYARRPASRLAGSSVERAGRARRVGRRRHGDESLRVGVARAPDDSLGRPDLHDLAEVHGDRAGGAGHPRAAQPVHPGARIGVTLARSADRGERARRTILEGETPDAAHIPTGCRFHPRCPVAFDRCKVEEPPLFDVGGGQSAACWLAKDGAFRSRLLPRPSTRLPPSAPADAGTQREAPRRPDPPPAWSLRDRTEPVVRRSDRGPPRRRRTDRGSGDGRARGRRWLAPGAGGVERERVRRSPHRGRAARFRRTRPGDPGRGSAATSRPISRAGIHRPSQTHDEITRRPGRTSSDEFVALRANGVDLVRGLRPDDLARVGMHPDVGPLRVDEVIAEWVHHDRNHIRQLLEVTQTRVWSQMGNARRFSLEDL